MYRLLHNVFFLVYVGTEQAEQLLNGIMDSLAENANDLRGIKRRVDGTECRDECHDCDKKVCREQTGPKVPCHNYPLCANTYGHFKECSHNKRCTQRLCATCLLKIDNRRLWKCEKHKNAR